MTMFRVSRFRIRAFSLVELVVVVVIIGIISAIAVVRVSQGARAANDSALKASLAAIRSAIDHYASEHQGAFPGLHRADGSQEYDGLAYAFEAQLIRHTAITGKTGKYNPSATPPIIYGPYLQRGIPPQPVGPNAGDIRVKIDKTGSPPPVSEDTGKGWVYNPETGEIIANTNDLDSSGRAYSAY